MKKISIMFIVLCGLIVPLSGFAEAVSMDVAEVTIKEAITPVTEKYMERAMMEARSAGYSAVLYTLDTPGGLLESTRNIVQGLLTADDYGIDTIVYVYPQGSRAGSAGVFITLSAKYAAMAPGCNIGAAHPVTIGEQEEDDGANIWDVLKIALSGTNDSEEGVTETEDEEPSNADHLAQKIENDTVAFIESICIARGRNVEWGIDAVLESVSIDSDEALAEGVIDYVADNPEELLKSIYGEDVVFNRIIIEKSWGENLLSALANPNLAYFLLILGLIGIGMEIRNPGSIFPGAVGAVFFILGLFSNQVLPMNYAGLFLLILAVVMFILEISITSYGMLTIGGIISFILGSAMLFDSPLSYFRVSAGVITFAGLLLGGMMAMMMAFIVPALKKRVVSGKEGMEGLVGVAVKDFVKGKGQIRIHGEIWSAVSKDDIYADDEVRVDSSEGLKLFVEKEIK